MRLENVFSPRIGYALAVTGLPAFLWSAYEMYFLTPKAGPQLLVFSSLKTLNPLIAGLWIISMSAFLLTGVLALVSLALFRAQKLDFSPGYLKFLVNALQITGVHIFLFLLYYEWANLLFG